MVFAWKAAGFTYNRYLAVASRILRQVLKDDKKLDALRAAPSELKIQKWSNGRSSDSELLSRVSATVKSESPSA